LYHFYHTFFKRLHLFYCGRTVLRFETKSFLVGRCNWIKVMVMESLNIYILHHFWILLCVPHEVKAEASRLFSHSHVMVFFIRHDKVFAVKIDGPRRMFDAELFSKKFCVPY